MKYERGRVRHRDTAGILAVSNQGLVPREPTGLSLTETSPGHGLIATVWGMAMARVAVRLTEETKRRMVVEERRAARRRAEYTTCMAISGDSERQSGFILVGHWPEDKFVRELETMELMQRGTNSACGRRPAGAGKGRAFRQKRLSRVRPLPPSSPPPKSP